MAIEQSPKCPRCSSADTKYNVFVSHYGSNYYMLTRDELRKNEERRKRQRPKCDERDCYRGSPCDSIERWPELPECWCKSCNQSFCTPDKSLGRQKAVKHIQETFKNTMEINQAVIGGDPPWR
jgi:hypothetical protein